MWITLYDVSRNGIGIIPWFLALLWIAGIIGGLFFVLARPTGRLFLALWLTFWLVVGGVGMWNVFYQYAANLRALRTGRCAVIEGSIENFHPQNIMRKGDSEHFVVGGHEFQYDYDNLGGGGLRSSKSFRVPLREGLYVKVWYRRGIICRLDASPSLSSSLLRNSKNEERFFGRPLSKGESYRFRLRILRMTAATTGSHRSS